MSWIDPLSVVPESRPNGPFIRAKDGARMPDTSRPVVVLGVHYRSITEASRQLHCSITKIYRLIGEPHRYAKKQKVAA